MIYFSDLNCDKIQRSKLKSLRQHEIHEIMSNLKSIIFDLCQPVNHAARIHRDIAISKLDESFINVELSIHCANKGEM